MQKLGYWVGVGLLLCLTACRTVVPPPPEVQSPANDRVLVEQFAQACVDDGNAGVFVAVIFPDGHECVVTRGTSDFADPTKPLNEQSIFRIGSLTKNLVFLLAEELERQRKLDLEQSVWTTAGADYGLLPAYAHITLRDLLLHRSGLPRESYPWYRLSPALCAIFSDTHIYSDFDTRAKLIAVLNNRECVAAVSEPCIRYSNLGYGLLGLMLEAQTGQSLPDLLATYVTQPLGLTDTTFTLTDEQKARLVGAHSGNIPPTWFRNRPVRAYELGEGLRATGGLYSSGADQVKCLRKFRDEFLARDAKAPYSLTSEGVIHINHYLHYSPRGHRWLLRFGMTYGSAAFLGFDLENRVAVLILRNNCDWPDDWGETLLLQLEVYCACPQL